MATQQSYSPDYLADANDPDLKTRHLEAEVMMRAFDYFNAPRGKENRFGVTRAQLGATEMLHANVQLIKKGGPSGGDAHLHFHTNIDSFWMVLKGKVRFYTEGDAVTGEFGPMQGIFTPRFSRYWFQAISDDDVELLHVFAMAKTGPGADSGRTYFAPRD